MMEILVVIAIIIVIAAIAFPVITGLRVRANKAHALATMKSLGTAIGSYAAQNDGALPDEDTPGKDGWTAATEPAAAKAWYNALPKLLSSKGVGDFVRDGTEAAFYSRESVLFLPGAQYPEVKKKQKPLFAIAINTKIHRKSIDGEKVAMKLQNVQLPARTVIFLEQGLPGERPKAHDTMSGKDYDGAPKGSAKSFVARYNKRGIITFLDGHAEEVSGKDLLTGAGDIVWDEKLSETNPSAIFWTADPKQDPNKKAVSK